MSLSQKTIWALSKRNIRLGPTSNIKNSSMTYNKFPGKTISWKWHNQVKTCQLWSLNPSRRSSMFWATTFHNFCRRYRVWDPSPNRSLPTWSAEGLSLCRQSALTQSWLSSTCKWMEPTLDKFQLTKLLGTLIISALNQFNNSCQIPLANFSAKIYHKSLKNTLISSALRDYWCLISLIY